MHLIGAGPRDGEIDPLLRIARSVRRDQQHFWVNPRFGWLPDDIASVPWTFSVSSQDGAWSEQTGERRLPPPGQDRRTGSARTTGRDRPGCHLARSNRAETRRCGYAAWTALQADDRVLYFTLPDGIQVRLMITPYGSEQPASDLADALRIAEELDFGQWPDMSWVNSR